ncbi:PstS family phosphate ABC transporter substrate-binding protein [Mucilaginibacter sp. L3T2-6]|uniref:PstS family phosphate ABC transporter substrate-binding protein n=1 Tax=Mucilaginibacter sp. L3T2-6 TaxID=3062491 RepID=UPI002676B12E|nr:substrate-binding domain-containing protein [Mucilaginibacter sp. L3T2-6]MDO3640725.1 substrate-binding domain-containing protein [Mucilaginibacter sp. L3T2-6]MDV6212934.1 substrate-binding domain-containing protein [Mucilaginibacter sp. L3T2-6]
MKFSFKLFCTGTLILGALGSCKQKAEKAPNADRASIFVVDESFKPIIEQELYVYKDTYKKSHPRVIYAPENNAVNMLFSDSVRVLILAREMNAEENKVLQSKNIKPIVNCFAIDAVTLIVNQASKDTAITVSEIKKMLNGNTKTDKDIVFDNPNSGLVRYLKEFSGSNLKQKNIYSLKSNKEVIKYVSGHPNAIGITGFSWLNDPEKDYEDAVNRVKIMSVKDDVKNPSGAYYSPSQETLALKQYPLTRSLYILNFTGKMGIGMEFAAFVAGDRGQRIILKSGLLPFAIPGREVNIIRKVIQ